MEILNLGKTYYLEALSFQLKLFNDKQKGLIDRDFIIVTEHYPVYTKGKSTKEEHLTEIIDTPVVEVERGGSVTFHGPGQIVVYPIIDLKKRRKTSVRNYIWSLEEGIIRTLNELGIEGFRVEGKRGVFTKKGKVGFVGVKISKYITMHGISLNVSVDKDFFSRIVPCGIYDIPVCNISDFIDVDKEKVQEILIKNLLSLL